MPYTPDRIGNKYMGWYKVSTRVSIWVMVSICVSVMVNICVSVMVRICVSVSLIYVLV